MRRPAILYIQNDYGQGLAKDAEEQFRAIGIEPILESHQASDNDLTPQLLSAGGQGIFTMALCAAPLVLGIVSEATKKGFPRWMGGVSLATMLLAAMKTSGDNSDLNNIMMAAFFAMILAIVLLIRPEKASA